MKRFFIALVFTGLTLATHAQSSMQLTYPGQSPYIDFANDAITDYDVRLVLSNDDLLSLHSGDFRLADGNLSFGLADRGLVFYGGGEKIIGTAAYGLQFLTSSSTPRMTILNNGNIGIGTSTPGGSLHVYGSNANAWMYVNGNVNGVANNPQNIPGLAFGWNRSAGLGESSIIYNTATGAAPRLTFSSFNGSSFNDELTIRGGRLGVGVTAPSGKLHLSVGDETVESAIAIRQSNDNAFGFDISLDQNLSNGNLFIHRVFGNTPYKVMEMDRSTGYVGIGTMPQSPLDVVGNLTLRNMGNVPHAGVSIHFTSQDLNPGPMIRSDLYYAGGTNSQAGLILSSYDGGYKNEMILAGGNVGIGTLSPDAKLAVKGQIHAQEVKVDLNGAVAPDYVFEKGYDLPSLESVKTYIDQNKHLPEVPSAKEMEAHGINLGEMNMLLLKKVEELTLYMIEQNKRIDLQNETLQKQTERIVKLEKQHN